MASHMAILNNMTGTHTVAVSSVKLIIKLGGSGPLLCMAWYSSQNGNNIHVPFELKFSFTTPESAQQIDPDTTSNQLFW